MLLTEAYLEPGQKALLTLTMNYRKIIQKNNLCHPNQQQQIGYLIYVVISSLVVLIEELAFFNMTSSRRISAAIKLLLAKIKYLKQPRYHAKIITPLKHLLNL